MKRDIALRVLDFVFGCHHRELSRVFTIDRRSYKVCCGCGASFQYSLATMSMDHRRVPVSNPASAALRMA